MQVALPRTQDAGKLQEQMGKQYEHFQESITANQLKLEELKKRKSMNLRVLNIFNVRAEKIISSMK